MRHLKWVFLLCLFACCSRTSQEQKTLRLSFNVEPTTVDPREAGDFASSTLVCLMYEGLTRCLPGGAVEPALAESVEISPDKKTYLFHLRQAAWSNGELITAHDFERSWKKILHPPSICAYLFYPIKGAEKCAKGELPIEAVGINALDEKTLRVELEYPTPYFYSLTAFPSFLPAHDDSAVISGPFRMRKTKGEILLTKNPTYWNREEISVDQIQISIVSDEMTAYQMFERGDLDWLGGPLSPLPPDAINQYQEALTFIPSSATTFISFNTETFPFNNPHLRKAFALAINRREIVEKVTQAGQSAACRILPPALTGKEPLLPPFDPAAARSHLAQAEIEIPPLTLYYKPGQIEKRLAQTLERQWEETLGIKVALVQLDFKSHLQRLQNRDYQIALSSWIAQFDDPISILERFKRKENLKNYPGWENQQYQRLLEEAATAPNRAELLLSAEELIAEETPLTPIYHWSSPALAGPRIAEIGATPSGGILFERFRLVH